MSELSSQARTLAHARARGMRCIGGMLDGQMLCIADGVTFTFSVEVMQIAEDRIEDIRGVYRLDWVDDEPVWRLAMGERCAPQP